MSATQTRRPSMVPERLAGSRGCAPLLPRSRFSTVPPEKQPEYSTTYDECQYRGRGAPESNRMRRTHIPLLRRMPPPGSDAPRQPFTTNGNQQQWQQEAA